MKQSLLPHHLVPTRTDTMASKDPILNLETTAEKSIGKEINLVGKKDLNHLDLVIEAKNNRLKSEFFYIYDYDKFNDCSLLKPNFDILAAHAITHTSARYVVHYLTKELKSRLKEIDRSKATKQEINAFYDIFKPSLGQFDESDIAEANDFIRKMFPYEGCSYTGAKLEKIITSANWITIILSLRIIWSLLPEAIVPWDSFKKFKEYEESTHFTHTQSFYQKMPLFLPSHNHCCVLFEFLEIFIAIFADDYLLDLKPALDLVFTAGQICFSRDEFKETSERTDDDLHELQKFYYKRGYSFHQIFVAYLRSLSKEPSFEHSSILDTFKISEYPPKPYEPVSQKALTLTVPADDELKTTNYFKLISMAANATSRIYSSNHTFTKFENKFLDKFEVNPHKIIEHFFSKSSKNYLLKFDKSLDFENFKVNEEISELRKNLKDGTIFENKEFVSTFISEFQRYGFESQRDNGNNAGTFLADTINFNFNSKLQNVDSLPVRVSKLDISEWFINAWKYETFLGYLQNTVVLKLTKTIGDCDWLIVTSHEKVSTTNRYLTPPSSAADGIDTKKEEELGGSLAEETEETSAEKRKSLLPAFSTKSTKVESLKKEEKKKEPCNPHGHPHASPLRKSPKPDLKRISFPSPPKDIAVFEKEVQNNDAPKTKEKKAKKSSSGSKQKKRQELDKPLPVPVMPKQKITTPTQQVMESMPTPPQLVQDSHNTDSLISTSNVIAGANFEIATPMTIKNQRVSPKLMKPSTPSSSHHSSNSPKTDKLPATPDRQHGYDSPLLEKPVIPHVPKSSPLSVEPSLPSETPDVVPSSSLPSAVVDPAEGEKLTAPSLSQQTLRSPVVPQRLVAPPKVTTLSGCAPDTPTSPVVAKLARAPSPPPSMGSSTRSSARSSHPYQMLKATPAPQQPNFKPPEKPTQGTSKAPPSLSTERFKTSPISPPTQVAKKTSKSRLGKLKVQTTSEKEKSKNTSPAPSPIAQIVPKFFSKKHNAELSKLTNSDSSGSLSHINDGSGTDLPMRQPTIIVNNPELKVSVESIPEIPYTPRALRESTMPSNYDTTSNSSGNESDLSKAISDNRESFVGNLSSVTRDSKSVFDNESDTTQDTTKSTSASFEKVSNHLDGLMEEIRESLEGDKFFDSREDSPSDAATVSAN